MGGHIPANRWQRALARMEKNKNSPWACFAYFYIAKLDLTTQDYCSQKVSVTRVWQTWGRLEIIHVNLLLCAHKYTKASLELLQFPSKETYYQLLLNRVILPITQTLHFTALCNSNNLFPKLDVLCNQIIEHFHSRLPRLKGKINPPPFSSTVSSISPLVLNLCLACTQVL